MAIAGSCVSTMEMPCLWITTSPGSATFLYTGNTRKRHTGRLASLASRHQGPYDLIIRHRRHHCGTWAEQSRMSSQPFGPCGMAIGERLVSDAGVIPGADTVGALLRWWSTTGRSQFVLGWICPSFAKIQVGWHSISWIAKTTFVRYSPCPPLP